MTYCVNFLQITWSLIHHFTVTIFVLATISTGVVAQKVDSLDIYSTSEFDDSVIKNFIRKQVPILRNKMRVSIFERTRPKNLQTDAKSVRVCTKEPEIQYKLDEMKEILDQNKLRKRYESISRRHVLLVATEKNLDIDNMMIAFFAIIELSDCRLVTVDKSCNVSASAIAVRSPVVDGQMILSEGVLLDTDERLDKLFAEFQKMVPAANVWCQWK